MAGGIFAGNISDNNETIEEFEDIIGKENVRVESVWIGKKCKKCTA